jgi:hypothetical protein
MRRYIIVSGILLVLPIINLALAAPVLVREKCRACVDVAYMPMTALGERGTGEELEKLAEEGYLKTLGKPADSSGTHATPSSESAPSKPDHGSTNVVQAPFPYSALTQAHTPQLNPNPKPLEEPFDWNHWQKVVDSEPSPPKTVLFTPSNPKPSTDSKFNWKNNFKNLPSTGLGSNWKNNLKNLVNLKNPRPPGPASSQPTIEKPSTGLGLNWKKLINPKEAPPPDQASSSSSSQASNPKLTTSIISGLSGFAGKAIDLLGKFDPLPRPIHSASSEHWQSWDGVSESWGGSGSSSRPKAPLKIRPPNESPKDSAEVEVAPRPPSSPDSSPEHSLSSGSSQVDLVDAVYKAKGKAKDTTVVSYFPVPNSGSSAYYTF